MTLLTDDYMSEPLLEDDFEWLKENGRKFLPTIKKALTSGKSPQFIFNYYMSYSPNREALWLRVKHAALYLQKNPTAE